MIRCGAVGALGLAMAATLASCGSSTPAAQVTDPDPASGQSIVAFHSKPAPLANDDRLRVASIDGTRRLVDGHRREINLRGVNVNGLVDYGPSGLKPVAVRTSDLGQISSLGLNVVRLSVSWSKVMPQPGRLDRAYLRRITALVAAGAKRHVYTVISMHSDRYAAGLGSGTEFDGAPRWAVRTGGASCGDPRPRYYTPCAAAAARAFYRGDEVAGRSLQDWYADAVVAVSTAGRAGGPGYSGLDILNEPTDPDASPDAAATSGWKRELAHLQRELVRRLRASGDASPVWIQPQGPRSTAATGAAVLPTGLSGNQLVYAPHAYIDVYGSQPTAATQSRLPAQYEAFAAEGKRLGAAVVVGEFPGAAGDRWDFLRRLHLSEQRTTGIGGIAWLWKQPKAGYGWETVKLDGSARTGTDATKTLGAARVVAGSPAITLTEHSDFSVTVAGTGKAQTVDLWLGARFGAPNDEQLLYALAPGSGETRITGEWSQRAQTPAGTTTGTLVRLRLAATPSDVRLELDAP